MTLLMWCGSKSAPVWEVVCVRLVFSSLHESGSSGDNERQFSWRLKDFEVREVRVASAELCRFAAHWLRGGGPWTSSHFCSAVISEGTFKGDLVAGRDSGRGACVSRSASQRPSDRRRRR